MPLFRLARWPAPCLICQQWAQGGLCPPCLQRFAAPAPRCTGCGLRLADTGGTLRCGACLQTPPPVAGTVAALDYGFPWDGLIGAMKFGRRPELARVLARPLLDALAADAARSAQQVDLLLPVPLWAGRATERGYNQSWELASALARALGRPARDGLLQRWRPTNTQSLLADPITRQANIKGAFVLGRDAPRALAGRRVALVDDVMTTGATAFEAARTLQQAGVAEIRLWVLARTPKSSG